MYAFRSFFSINAQRCLGTEKKKNSRFPVLAYHAAPEMVTHCVMVHAVPMWRRLRPENQYAQMAFPLRLSGEENFNTNSIVCCYIIWTDECARADFWIRLSLSVIFTLTTSLWHFPNPKLHCCTCPRYRNRFPLSGATGASLCRSTTVGILLILLDVSGFGFQISADFAGMTKVFADLPV